MLKNPEVKYRPFPPVDLPSRTWPSKQLVAPPRWCSVDLRDGNQALVDPMDVERKLRFFDLLLKAGFKEIEVSFPSASQTDFDLTRQLIDSRLVPQDVTIQVLTQARPELIERTFECLEGASSAIVHLYNAIAPVFRRVVFGTDREGVKEIALSGTRLITELCQRNPGTKWTYEYSPETFSSTELEFSLEVCEAVAEIWRPSADRPLIFNLPSTVEVASPNVYADQIEWFSRKLSCRNEVTISVHPHNDRGTGVAAAELALMAGADRVEGCLFGNGERTGNVDLVTLALNFYVQGIHPKLDFSDMKTVVNTVSYCNGIGIHQRHPYAGELVFTAFSGSHQDAIKKGFAAQRARNDELWEMPYLTIDPADLGSSYEAVIRVNSQSGKGGVSWVLEQDWGLQLPRRMQANFSQAVQAVADRTSREMTSSDIWQIFQETYRMLSPQRLSLTEYSEPGPRKPGRSRNFVGKITVDGRECVVSGHGNGLISSAVNAIRTSLGIELEVIDYHEHAISHGSDAQAAAYIECRTKSGDSIFGVGMDTDVAMASLKAVLSAANQIAIG